MTCKTDVAERQGGAETCQRITPRCFAAVNSQKEHILCWEAHKMLLCCLFGQVVFRPLIRARRYDTSYSYLARRAKRGNNGLNNLVRSGSIARRITVYGELIISTNLAGSTPPTAVIHMFAVITYQSLSVFFTLFLIIFS